MKEKRQERSYMKKYPVKNPDIVARKEEKEALLFNPSDGRLMCINGTGILVWDMSDGTSEISDIISRITQGYDVAAERAQVDCVTYLDDLEKAGFITYRI
jgi:hypothetical protein